MGWRSRSGEGGMEVAEWRGWDGVKVVKWCGCVVVVEWRGWSGANVVQWSRSRGV